MPPHFDYDAHKSNNPDGKRPWCDTIGYYYTRDVNFAEIINNISNDYLLCEEGLFTPRYKKRIFDKAGKEPTPINVKKPILEHLATLIPFLFVHSERKSIDSYKGKHMVEKLFHTGYISNGEFILAMMSHATTKNGEFKRKEQGDSPNAVFYVTVTPAFQEWLDEEEGTDPTGTSDKLTHMNWKFSL